MKTLIQRAHELQSINAIKQAKTLEEKEKAIKDARYIKAYLTLNN